MKKILIIILTIILCSGCKSTPQATIESSTINYNNEFNTYYGYLTIPKIKMHQGFYNTTNKLNDVSKNIELINTGIKNTYLFAAHSGVGNIAYFNDLRYLKTGDEIKLELKTITYIYKVIEIKKEPKTGKITIPNKENQIILTTCDQIEKGKQLIIIASFIDTKNPSNN